MTSSDLLALLIGLPLGALFIASAVPKLRHPSAFALTVLQYDVLPPALGRLYAHLLPVLELLAALLLLSGVVMRLAALLAIALLISFIVAVGINLARGRTLDCGCFGASGRHVGWRLLVEDIILLAMTLLLVTGSNRIYTAWSPFSAFDSQSDGANVFVWGVSMVVCGASLLVKARSHIYRLDARVTQFAQSVQQAMERIHLTTSPLALRARASDRSGIYRSGISGDVVLEPGLPAPKPLSTVSGVSDAENSAQVAYSSRAIDKADAPVRVTLPDLQLTSSLNGFDSVDLSAAHSGDGLLIVFLSPLCLSCQQLVRSLNALKQNVAFRQRMIVVLRGEERIARTFLQVFPLEIPAVRDSLGAFARELDIHQMPAALLFNRDGLLVYREHPITHDLAALALTLEAPA